MQEEWEFSNQLLLSSNWRSIKLGYKSEDASNLFINSVSPFPISNDDDDDEITAVATQYVIHSES